MRRASVPVVKSSEKASLQNMSIFAGAPLVKKCVHVFVRPDLAHSGPTAPLLFGAHAPPAGCCRWHARGCASSGGPAACPVAQ